jgi:hypothetical protein
MWGWRQVGIVACLGVKATVTVKYREMTFFGQVWEKQKAKQKQIPTG